MLLTIEWMFDHDKFDALRIAVFIQPGPRRAGRPGPVA
jgi:hypothetical protein